MPFFAVAPKVKYWSSCVYHGEAMSTVFDKLNFKGHAEILVIRAPESFEAELVSLTGVTIHRKASEVQKVRFLLAFGTTQREVDATAKSAASKTEGDATVWFAYPKGTSKKYKCEFNRDSGFGALGEVGFEGVRQVAIDEDWSALRFRRVEFIKTMKRNEKLALSPQGKARTKK